MIDRTTTTPSATGFEPHGGRGRFTAVFFKVMGPYLEWNLRPRKRRVCAGLLREVVEIGPGVGANLRYLPAGGALVAIEPNRYMHGRLHAAARRSSVRLDLRERYGRADGAPRPAPRNGSFVVRGPGPSRVARANET